MNKAVAVIGGGPAGMMAAGTAAGLGAKVILFEKNHEPGRKLLITGKGRCNITNYADTQTLINSISRNGNFMYSSFSAFDSYGTVDFFESLGLKTKVERGSRVFPESDKAADVLAAMLAFIKKQGVKLEAGAEVKSVRQDGSGRFAVNTSGGTSAFGSVIIATGGLSYPATGSTGDGYRFAEKFGHGVTDLRPSLVPLVCKERWLADAQGLSLKNTGLKLFISGKLVYQDTGELMITHYGLSGPLVLTASTRIGPNDRDTEVSLDLKPALTDEVLNKRLLRDFSKNINRDFRNSLDELLPRKLIPVIIERSGIAPDKKTNEITKEERAALTSLLKNMKLRVTGNRGFKEAVITKGGVATQELNPRTMESRLVPGLYFCGEVLDLDALTGGFNLQIAFSTGRAAGMAAGGIEC